MDPEPLAVGENVTGIAIVSISHIPFDQLVSEDFGLGPTDFGSYSKLLPFKPTQCGLRSVDQVRRDRLATENDPAVR